MERITLDNVHLLFTPYNRLAVSLKDSVLRHLLRRQGPPRPQVHALRGVSFAVRDGERLGILGHNGAGKSSLLRVLAGVYRPTSGACCIHGRISSLFELTMGFEPEATGWENIRYRGYMQKETPRSIRAKMAEIARFSELGPALDMPIRYYSSGMLIRLAFAIASAVEPEVLLIDEVLAASDLAFIEKARRRLLSLRAGPGHCHGQPRHAQPGNDVRPCPVVARGTGSHGRTGRAGCARLRGIHAGTSRPGSVMAEKRTRINAD
jgi:ABC-type polysaccharide/polyol phosphate transport system ATPase subunit